MRHIKPYLLITITGLALSGCASHHASHHDTESSQPYSQYNSYVVKVKASNIVPDFHNMFVQAMSATAAAAAGVTSRVHVPGTTTNAATGTVDGAIFTFTPNAGGTGNAVIPSNAAPAYVKIKVDWRNVSSPLKPHITHDIAAFSIQSSGRYTNNGSTSSKCGGNKTSCTVYVTMDGNISVDKAP